MLFAFSDQHPEMFYSQWETQQILTLKKLEPEDFGISYL